MLPDHVTQSQIDACSKGVESLLEAFKDVPDFRKVRGIRFPLHSTLALCTVAFVCGCENLTQVMRFGRRHPQLLIALEFPRPRSPSVPTLSRVLGKTKGSDLQKALARWMRGLVDSGRKQKLCAVASVDGKTSRSTGIHMLNVFLHDVQQVLWQVPVEAKKNEISAFKQALSAMLENYPFLQIITGDAMFAGAPLCSDLIEHGRHYLFAIKGDQKHLYEKLELVFAPQIARAAKPDAVTGEKKRLCVGA